MRNPPGLRSIARRKSSGRHKTALLEFIAQNFSCPLIESKALSARERTHDLPQQVTGRTSGGLLAAGDQIKRQPTACTPRDQGSNALP